MIYKEESCLTYFVVNILIYKYTSWHVTPKKIKIKKIIHANLTVAGSMGFLCSSSLPSSVSQTVKL